MKLQKISIVTLLSCAALAASGIPPVKYVVAVRDAEGKALADREMSFAVDILDSPVAVDPLYTETHRATSTPEGTVLLMIGAGNSTSGVSFDDIDWSATRYLRISVNPDGSGFRTMGVSELGAAPVAMQTAACRSLICTSPSGTPWELTVSDNGTLSWNCLGEVPDIPPDYPVERIPEHLYFIGTFNNWNVSEAVPMDKLSAYRFSITRALTSGEIFKFVPTQSWENDYDWSGEQMAFDSPVPMREFGNTPEFTGPDGVYTITVDFHSYTMTITSK